MNHLQVITAGLAGGKLSRSITGTDEVCASRSAVATGAGAFLGAASVGAVAAGATAVGATTLAAFAAPVVLPVAIAAGAVGLIRSLFD
jgi:hypothetical protein